MTLTPAMVPNVTERLNSKPTPKARRIKTTTTLRPPTSTSASQNVAHISLQLLLADNLDEKLFQRKLDRLHRQDRHANPSQRVEKIVELIRIARPEPNHASLPRCRRNHRFGRP